jgi:hypothetical protein
MEYCVCEHPLNICDTENHINFICLNCNKYHVSNDGNEEAMDVIRSYNAPSVITPSDIIVNDNTVDIILPNITHLSDFYINTFIIITIIFTVSVTIIIIIT